MNQSTLFCAALSVFLSAAVCAWSAPAAATNAATAVKPSPGTPAKIGAPAPGAASNVVKDARTTTSLGVKTTKTAGIKPLTDEQIEAFKHVHDEDGKKIQFTANCMVIRPATEQEKRRWEKKGIIPFRISAGLYELKAGKDGFTSRVLSGMASFYVQDAAGNVVDGKSSINLGKLYVQPGSSVGGYVGEVHGAGKYKVVIWTDHKTLGRFGDASDANMRLLEPPTPAK
jgi:hypothetical protein